MGRKLCSICNHRSVGTGPSIDIEYARSMGFCGPCTDEADWENMHSDNAHDDPNCVANGWETQDTIDRCWECHPELNLAHDRTPRRTGHTNTIAKSRTSHADHHHPRTPDHRAACRKSMAAGSGPLDLRSKK